MKLSTRTRYGSRAVFELAMAYPERTVSVKEVAQAQQLPTKYLEQIMAALKNAGLIRAVRGMHGGYTLTKPPASISLSEIFEALEGSPAPVECVDDPKTCAMRDMCPTRDMWVQMKEALARILEGTTIQDLVERKKRKGSSFTPTYHI